MPISLEIVEREAVQKTGLGLLRSSWDTTVRAYSSAGVQVMPSR